MSKRSKADTAKRVPLLAASGSACSAVGCWNPKYSRRTAPVDQCGSSRCAHCQVVQQHTVPSRTCLHPKEEVGRGRVFKFETVAAISGTTCLYLHIRKRGKLTTHTCARARTHTHTHTHTARTNLGEGRAIRGDAEILQVSHTTRLYE